MNDAERLIAALGLQPHPEGGQYRQMFRDAGNPRAYSTAIYYLLCAGEISRPHRIDAAEVWHYYRGAPLELTIKVEGGPLERLILGPGIETGERPQIVVPPRAWQGAKPLGGYTLVGCTVAPGFEFSTFEVAPPGVQFP
jgi:uncharacterized protein